MNGGELIAEVLLRQGVRFLFTLCGGHIAPILIGAKARGIQIIDTRSEAAAVFAADTVSRLSGIPGVAVVTAGPGVTNTITAIKNAQLAHSPLLVLGGATASILKGRGSLQDIDQLAAVRPHVKMAASIRRFKELPGTIERAFEAAQSGLPGPVFVECPVDLVYDEQLVRTLFGKKSRADMGKLSGLALQSGLSIYLNYRFFEAQRVRAGERRTAKIPTVSSKDVSRAADLLLAAKKPVLLVGSQPMHGGLEKATLVAQALKRLGAPIYLSGMGRGLLGRSHELLFRHKRKAALREADFVLLAGVPCDFRLNYGLHINRRASLISINRDPAWVKKNRIPSLGVSADPADFLIKLSERFIGDIRTWDGWVHQLRDRDRVREKEIQDQAHEQSELVNPLALCMEMETALSDDSCIIADGGDFVATASYILSPRGPLSWLDPGPFGTLGVGAGFALGAKLCRPNAEIWLLYGDGSAGYSLVELDTFVRHRLAVIMLVGNDASWAQIARDQVELLGDDVGTVLARSDYHKVAEGFGAKGLLVKREEEVPGIIQEAKRIAAEGIPVLINAHIAKSDFRKGSISL